jgi:hypothetical protein
MMSQQRTFMVLSETHKKTLDNSLKMKLTIFNKSVMLSMRLFFLARTVSAESMSKEFQINSDRSLMMMLIMDLNWKILFQD